MDFLSCSPSGCPHVRSCSGLTLQNAADSVVYLHLQLWVEAENSAIVLQLCATVFIHPIKMIYVSRAGKNAELCFYIVFTRGVTMHAFYLLYSFEEKKKKAVIIKQQFYTNSLFYSSGEDVVVPPPHPACPLRSSEIRACVLSYNQVRPSPGLW